MRVSGHQYELMRASPRVGTSRPRHPHPGICQMRLAFGRATAQITHSSATPANRQPTGGAPTNWAVICAAATGADSNPWRLGPQQSTPQDRCLVASVSTGQQSMRGYDHRV